MAKKIKKIKIRKGDFVFLIIVVFMLGIAVGTLTLPAREIEVTKENKNIINPSPEDKTVRIKIPAVDQNGNGVLGTLATTVRSGSGLILVNVNDVFAQPDTQQSGRIAAKAASDYTKISLENVDIIYDVEVNASVIEGPSAGSAMAVSVAFALQNESLNPNVMITGIIHEDGRITPAGAVLEKAKAAKDGGATRFLVSTNQSTGSEVERKRVCETKEEGGLQIESCRIRYENTNVNIGESIGIEIIEVSNIEEAISYFK